MNVVLYLRYSSSSQTEQSIEGQDRICTNFCNQQGFRIVGRYVDRALSASKNTDKRIEFQRMIKDSEKGLFDAVIVYKLDRFARSRYDSAIYKTKLAKNGVKVISATENISENPEGIILESVLEGMAEFYSKELSQKVRRGMYESASKCNSYGGVPLLGYKVENKKWVIDEEKAPLVREAYQRYANGEAIQAIIEDFNARGLRTSTGKPFNKSSFQRVFGNEKYIGIYSFNELKIEGGIPAIIDKELFYMVKERKEHITKTQPKRGVAKVDFLLQGKIFCGYCGKNMTGCTGTSSNGSKHHYYECPTHKKKHACRKTPIKKELIEQRVIEETSKLLTPDYIERLAEIVEKQSKLVCDQNLTRKSIESEIKEYTKSLKNLTKALEVGGDAETIINRIKELEEMKKDAEQRLKFEIDNDLIVTKDMVLFFFEKFLQMPKDDPDYGKILIDTLVNSVIVYDDDEEGGKRIKISWNLQYNIPTIVELDCSREDNICPPFINVDKIMIT